MKNFYIQSLVLTVTMVMAYTASLRKHPLTKAEVKQLYLIECQVNKTLEQSNALNETVIKASGNRTRCLADFFCFAEKALNTTKPPLNDSELYWLIHAFNNMTNRTHCHPKNTKYTVKELLDDIVYCAQARQ
ncbi:uncharacterized protein V6R79_019712 [Siganus canaliculatus]